MTRAFTLVVVEGALEVPVCLRLLAAVGGPTEGLRLINKGGRGGFWRDVARYNQAAARVGPVLGLADLETFSCPSGLIAKHLKHPKHPDFVLRIAERMIESWLLADDSLAEFFDISGALLPQDPDSVDHPKRTLVNLAHRSASPSLRRNLVPEPGSLGIVGKGYTPTMTEFIERRWHPQRAACRSESLRRALAAIQATARAKE